MKAFLILLLYMVFWLQTAQAQQNQYEYQKAYDYAKRLEARGDYFNAILCYNIANSMEKPDSNDIALRIAYCATKINQLRIEADIAKINAENATKELEKQKRKIDSLYKEAISSLIRIEEMQLKAETAIVDKAIKDHSTGWKGFNKYTVADLSSDSIKKILYEVDSLDLSYTGLYRIPREVIKCPNLIYINLFGNPDINWKDSEKTLKQLKNNVAISVSVTDLSEIDSSYWHIISGIEILSDTLTQIPQNILQQKQLKYLILGGNHLKKLPHEVGALTNLNKLFLSDNEIETIPSDIRKLINLLLIDLRKNNIYKLPPEIGELKNLTEINLDDNLLYTLPDEIGALENLTSLSVKNNDLIALPKEIGRLEKLTSLDLQGNRLINLPSEIGSLKNMSVLSLYENNLVSLTEEIWKLDKLTFLDLRRNDIEYLSPKIGSLTSLKTLGLGSNSLITLPKEIGKLANLSELSIEGNYLGEKRNMLQGLTNISILYIDVDQAESNSGVIANMKELSTLYLFGNNFENIIDKIKESESLTTLFLIGYTGIPLITIPDEIAGLSNLTTLYIIGDSLNTIPAAIAQLHGLTKLGLSIRKMNKLPREIAVLTNLVHLELSDTPINDIPDELFNLNLTSVDYFDIAQKLFSQRNYEQALRGYLKCLEIDSTYANAYGNIGLCYRMQGKYEKALEYLNKNLKLDRKNVWCINQLGYTYAAMNNVEEAFKYAGIEPSAGVWSGIGGQFVQAGNYEQALKSYFLSMEIDSTDEYTYGNIGLCYRLLGKPEEAIKNLNKSLSFNKKNTWSLNQMSYTYASMNNFIKAFEYAEESNSIKKDAGLWYETGNQLYEAKNYEQAIKCYKRSVDIDSTGPYSSAYNIIGICYSRLGNRNKAIENFEKAYSVTKQQILIDSTNYSNWYSLSFYCLFVNRYPEGIRAARKSLELAEDKESVITNLALNYLLNNQYNDMAKPLYEKWKDLRFPDDNRFAVELFLKDIGDLEAANITHPDFKKVRALLTENNSAQIPE